MRKDQDEFKDKKNRPKRQFDIKELKPSFL